MADDKNKDKASLLVLDPNNTDPDALDKINKQLNGKISPLYKSIVSLIQDSYSDEQKVNRLAFEIDPGRYNQYSSIFFPKENLLPDRILRRIAIQDDLVASIARIRGNQVASFGRHKENRYSIGFEIVPDKSVLDKATPEEKEQLNKRINKAIQRLLSCGEERGVEGVSGIGRLTLSQCLYVLAHDAVVLGRFAVEKIYKDDPYAKTRKFHSFRPLDVGTLMKAVPYKTGPESIRRQARSILERIKNEKLSPDRFKNDDYTWIQVIDGKPLQAFTDEEVIVYNCFPSADVAYGGCNAYPVSPIDTMIAAVATHINITNMNKLFFQHGRAARGMLVFKSEDADVGVINQVRQVFNASINSVTSSYRMPVFSITQNDEIEWKPIDIQGGRDGEFQFLSDNNCRVILAAFGMSPAEVPGFDHLYRGSGLASGSSESQNEQRLESAKDVGIRPLLRQFQDFLNYYIFPLIDPDLCKIATIVLGGIDSTSPAEEVALLAQQMPLYGTMNHLLEKMEMPQIPKEMGGEFLFNEAFKSTLDAYLTVGEILEFYFNRKGASKDPALNYRRDPFWFQQIQAVQAQQQMEMAVKQQNDAAEMQKQQMANDQAGQDAENAENERLKTANVKDVSSGVDQLLETLDKSEKQLPMAQKKLLRQHKLVVKAVMDKWEKDSDILLQEIINKAKNN